MPRHGENDDPAVLSRIVITQIGKIEVSRDDTPMRELRFSRDFRIRGVTDAQVVRMNRIVTFRGECIDHPRRQRCIDEELHECDDEATGST